MDFKHNKKRNSLFMYEALIRCLTRAIANEDKAKKANTINILKEFFSKSKPLYMEIELYKILSEPDSLNEKTAKRLLNEVYKVFNNFDQDDIYEEQSKLISKVNKELGKEVFGAHVPNYRNLATIYQLFHKKMNPKEKILLENRVLECLTSKNKSVSQKAMPKIDNLTLRVFVEGFNKEYSNVLLEEQSSLLQKYVLSDVDRGAEFKFFVNEEIGRIRDCLRSALEKEEAIIEDDGMVEKTKEALLMLESYKTKEVLDEASISLLMRYQSLVAEINSKEEQE